MSRYFQFHETNLLDALHCGDVLQPLTCVTFHEAVTEFAT